MVTWTLLSSRRRNTVMVNWKINTEMHSFVGTMFCIFPPKRGDSLAANLHDLPRYLFCTKCCWTLSKLPTSESSVQHLFVISDSQRDSQPSSKSWENQRDMAVANQQAKRDVIVSKDALLKSYRKRLKVNKTAQQSCIEDYLKILG